MTQRRPGSSNKKKLLKSAASDYIDPIVAVVDCVSALSRNQDP